MTAYVSGPPNPPRPAQDGVAFANAKDGNAALLRILGPRADEELAELAHWLMDDRDLRDEAEVSLVGPPARPTDMGDHATAIMILLTGAQALTPVLSLVLEWRRSRHGAAPNRTTIVIDHRGDRLTVSPEPDIDADDDDDAF